MSGREAVDIDRPQADATAKSSADVVRMLPDSTRGPRASCLSIMVMLGLIPPMNIVKSGVDITRCTIINMGRLPVRLTTYY